MLAGTSLNVRLTGATKAALIDPTVAGVDAGAAGGTVLETIVVAGNGGGVIGPDTSIVAQNSSTGSKTGTAILDTAAAVSVVTQKEMEQRGVKNLEQALAYTSGVTTDMYGSDDRYDFYLMRGFAQTGTGKYRDGLPMQISNFTGSRVEPYGMQRIEALKGSTSTLFGLNGPGGLVNSITKRPQDEKFGEVYTTFGEDHIETGTDFGGPIDEDGVWTYRLTGKWQDGGNGFDYSEDDRIYVAPALTWSPDDATSLTFMADYNKRDGNTGHGIPIGSGLDTTAFVGEPDFENMDTLEKNIGYAFEHDFGNGLQFRQNLRYTDLDLTYETVYGGSTDPADDRLAFAVYGQSQQIALDNQLQYDASFGLFDSRTLLGFDVTHTDASEVRYDGSADGIDIYNPAFCGTACITWNTVNTTDNSMLRKGVYLQEELTFDDRWILTLGGRYDNVSQQSVTVGPWASDYDFTTEAFTKRIGLTYKATSEVSLYANYAESFEPVALYYTTSLADPKPVEGQQYEIGAKYQPEGMDALFSVALFDLTQKNTPQTTTALLTEQIGEINVKGVELEGKFAVTDRANVTLAYTYLDAEIIEDGNGTNEGNRPELVPEHMASAWVDYTIPGNGTFGDFTFGVGARYVGSNYDDNANTIDIASRTLVDAALSYKVTDSTTLSINATNIFDKKYITHYDSYANLEFYGDRRTVKATLKYTW
ncbi:TonB-dependent siderophore receptor (plasmid) [Rhizobium sp. SL42]|nr:TonB-dependent siderophore receptor [Rhizobium sp. SL42]